MLPTLRSFKSTMRHLTLAMLPLLLGACGSGSDGAGESEWSGTMDTLPSGEIVVRNADDPLWTPEEAWSVVEELRIGEALSEGPNLVRGRILLRCRRMGPDLRPRPSGAGSPHLRLWGQLRSNGRGKGRGAGRFTQAGSVDLSLNGEIWVMGMSQGRVSIFDTTGTYLRGERTNTGGRMMLPYPGGFDPMGRYNVVLRPSVMNGMARFDQSYNPIDTISLPENPVEAEYFELVNEDGFTTLSAAVPFQGFMAWRFSLTGTVWTLLTDRYELIEMTTGGEVLRRVTKEHEPIPVTDEEREQAIENLEWFTSQGGQIDRSQFPRSKPSTASFFIDDAGNLWVEQQVAASDSDNAGRLFDLFDPEGRYLGTLRLPFSLAWSRPEPIVREGILYGVTSDEVGGAVRRARPDRQTLRPFVGE